MAYFLRGAAEAPVGAAIDLAPVGGDVFQVSGIHVASGIEQTSGIYV